MDYFGINSAEELPKIREVGESPVDATVVNPTFGVNVESNEELLAVTGSGELIVKDDETSKEEE